MEEKEQPLVERYKMRENTQAMQAAYSLAKDHGKLVEDSDGQFTGGGRHELYEVNSENVLHEFLFEGDSLVEFTIYDKETYYGRI